MSAFRPFDNETDAVGIGDLEIENRVDRVSIHGSLDITRDRAGLKAAIALKGILDRTLEALSREDLPDKVAVIPPKTVKNPFGGQA